MKEPFFNYIVEWVGEVAGFKRRGFAVSFALERKKFGNDVKIYDNARLCYIDPLDWII